MATKHRDANYFLAVRITDDEIKNRLGEVRKHMIQHNHNYQNVTTTKECLHLTLCLLTIKNSIQLQVVGQALKEVSQLLRDKNGGKGTRTRIKLSCMSTFGGNKVVYANVECPRDFHVMRAAILAHLDEAGVTIASQTFNPHVTVAKVTSASRCRGVGSVDPASYEDFRYTMFGEQEVQDIYLCEMGNQRQADGFYVTKAKVPV